MARLSPEDARQQLDTAIDWGRFAELYDYDTATERITADAKSGIDPRAAKAVERASLVDSGVVSVVTAIVSVLLLLTVLAGASRPRPFGTGRSVQWLFVAMGILLAASAGLPENLADSAHDFARPSSAECAAGCPRTTIAANGTPHNAITGASVGAATPSTR